MTYEYRSARRFREPSPLFRWCAERGYFSSPGHALVFGGGLLLEAIELASLGWTVDVVETADSVERRRILYDEAGCEHHVRILTDLHQSKRRYRVIVVTHVLEFIRSPSERDRTLRSLQERLTAEGCLILSLRGWSDVRAAKTQRPDGDGIVTGLGTWTRGYTVEEAESLLQRAGLAITDGSAGSKAKSPEQVRLVCRRSE